MTIQKTTIHQLNTLMLLFDEARGTIAQLGIDQWQDGYPSREVIENDILSGNSYAVIHDGKLVGTFVLLFNGEPTYDMIYDGKWLTDDLRGYTAIHRVAVSVASRGTGVSTAILDYARQKAIEHGHRSLRIDTHEGNVVMRRMLEKHGFVHCGTICLQNGAKRVAYEKSISFEDS